MNNLLYRLAALNLSLLMATVFLLACILLMNQIHTPVAGAAYLTSSPSGVLLPDNSSEAYPGTIVTYTHTLTNTGNSTDTFSLTVSSVNFSAFVTPITRTLAIGEPAQITVTVAVCQDAAAGLQDVSVVTATSAISPTIVATATNRTTIRQIASVTIEPTINSSNVDAGSQVQYEHTITNTGNGIDTFSIEADSNQNYDLSLSTASLTLTSGAATLITVTVNVPPDADGETMDVTIVSVTSNHWATTTVTATNITTVNTADNITFIPNNSGTAFPGQTVVYTHTLTNSGNRSNTVSLSAVSSRNYDISVFPDNVTLARNQSATITVTIAIPSGATVGEEVTTVTATPTQGNIHTVTNTTTVQHRQLFLPVINRPAQWETVGSQWPIGVVALSLVVCATNSNLQVAGTIDNGVWLKDGTIWSKATTIPDGFSATNVVINQACDTVYISLFDQGVWQGSHSGNEWTWAQLGGAEVEEARALTFADNVLYVGGEFGIRYWQNNSWQLTNITEAGSQPIMHMSVADPQNNAGPVYAVQWLNNRILHSTASPSVWEELSVPNIPDTLTRVVYGTTGGVQFVGTNNQSFQLQNNTWQELGVSAGLRAGVIGNNRSYLGYASGGGVYELYNNQLTPLTNGWTVPPTFIYELHLVDRKLFAATTTGVWVFSIP